MPIIVIHNCQQVKNHNNKLLYVLHTRQSGYHHGHSMNGGDVQ
jgi:hypothetical protein